MKHSRLVRIILAQVLVLGFLFSQEKDVKYVGSKNSTKYHYESCQWAQKISPSNLVVFESVKDASDAGYVACKVCKPPTIGSKSEVIPLTSPTKKQETYSGRCQATTKKGTQCKRNAKPGSKYCWQHGG